MLKWLESSFKRTINFNKYQYEVTQEAINQYLYHLTDASFQGLNQRFVLLFEEHAIKRAHRRYFLLKHEVKHYSDIIDGNVFHPSVNNDLRTFDSRDKQNRLGQFILGTTRIKIS